MTRSTCASSRKSSACNDAGLKPWTSCAPYVHVLPAPYALTRPP